MKIAIIGAGPAGLMCAIQAGQNINNQIILIDANEKVGKKLFITGKGRCNVCNFCSCDQFLKNVVTNSKFLYSAINKFSPQDTFNFFNNAGTKLKVERGSRVFPESDKSSDIIKTLVNQINKNNTKIMLNTKVTNICKDNAEFNIKTNNGVVNCDYLVIATGGKSYSSTGSTGDGYKFAKGFGHNIINAKPALVPIKLKNYNGSLAGLTLKNVEVSVNLNNKKYAQFGEMLFTHNGVSGPIILTLSSYLNKFNLKGVKLILNLKPALNDQILNDRLLRDFESNKNKLFKNYLKDLMPSSLTEFFIEGLNINPNKKLCEITKEERKEIIFKLQNIVFEIDSLDDIDVGIITSGGVDIKEINPTNMQSKKCENLFFAGEVMDVDALTGGFNIQIALSTGFLVGKFLAEKGDI